MKNFLSILLLSQCFLLAAGCRSELAAIKPKQEKFKMDNGVVDGNKDSNEAEKFLNDLQEKIATFENYVDTITKETKGEQAEKTQNEKVKKAQQELQAIRQELEEYKQKLSKFPQLKDELLVLDKKLNDLTPNIFNLETSEKNSEKLKRELLSKYGEKGEIKITPYAKPRKKRKRSEEEENQDKNEDQRFYLIPGHSVAKKQKQEESPEDNLEDNLGKK